MSQLRAESVGDTGASTFAGATLTACSDRAHSSSGPEPRITSAPAAFGDRRFSYDDFDRHVVLAGLDEDRPQTSAGGVTRYCLMTNHYHLLVRTHEPDLSVGMWRLNQRHALRINRRHSFVGHAFEGRFFAELIEDDPYFVAVARYIDQNPVRAAVCRSPEAWPWSGCGATLGLRPRRSFFDPSRRSRVLRGRPRAARDDVRALPPGLQPA